jgi:hypothetical protein
MNALTGGTWRKCFLVIMLASALVFTSSCSAPQSVPRPRPQFTAMPLLIQWGKPNYVTIMGPVTRTGSKTFTISARTGIAAWLGCIGKGIVWLSGPLALTAVCGDGDGGAWGGALTEPTHMRPGQKVTVRVVAPATATWELRIDGTPIGHS